MDNKPMKLSEIADRINRHLRRFEADPIINATSETWGTRPYYQPGAFPAGRYVAVRYVSYQHTWNLTKSDALRYLAALDAGFVGRHLHAPEPTDER